MAERFENLRLGNITEWQNGKKETESWTKPQHKYVYVDKHKLLHSHRALDKLREYINRTSFSFLIPAKKSENPKKITRKFEKAKRK